MDVPIYTLMFFPQIHILYFMFNNAIEKGYQNIVWLQLYIVVQGYFDKVHLSYCLFNNQVKQIFIINLKNNTRAQIFHFLGFFHKNGSMDFLGDFLCFLGLFWLLWNHQLN
jgi:hypothetical protein